MQNSPHRSTQSPSLPEDSLGYALLAAAELVAEVGAGRTLTDALAALWDARPATPSGVRGAILDLAYSTLRRRVAMALIEIYHKFQNASSPGSVLEITREDVAHYVGTATESLIRTITDFKSEGIVDIISGKIRINNISKLENLYY